MPGRARFLIEGVYGAGKQEVPDVFLDAEGESWSDKAAQKSMGEYNSLQLEKGFCRESGSGWGEEKRVPTRLGDKQVKVYFGVRKGDKIYPMYKERMGWELSSLSLRDGKIKEVYYSRNDLPLIKKLRESEKQFYEWDIILVSREEEEVPAFPGLNNKNNSIEIVYDPRDP